tara:strand:+ start:11277 stop:12641 length:1365 start_codon:yes stop_codon:yes gene_type:complete
MWNKVIFREYDIRGVYNQDYDLAFAEELGRAYYRLATKKLDKQDLTISLGHDARHSSPEIIAALAKGLKESGAKIIQLNLITTPISYFSTFYMPNVDGAIMVTGSHNPPEYNGFKISIGKKTIMGEEIQNLRQIIERQDYISGDGSEEHYDIFPEYVARYKEEFRDLSGIKVIADCGNGVAGVVLRKMYEALNVDLEILYEKPDGDFPNHHPDPTVESNMEELKKQVLEKNADIGIGFDGDADRLGVISNTGRFLLGDEIMALITGQILKEQPKATIIGDVKCSDRLYHYIEERGGKAIMWKTGHSLIKNKVREEGAPFGGELSCHLFFADRNYGYDDSLYAGLRLIELLKVSHKSIEDLLSDYPQAYTTPEIRLDTSEEKKSLIVDKIKEHYKSKKDVDLNMIDGVRASFSDGWALVRPSNTQPVISMRFEAESEEALKRIQDEAMTIVNEYL